MPWRICLSITLIVGLLAPTIWAEAGDDAHPPAAEASDAEKDARAEAEKAIREHFDAFIEAREKNHWPRPHIMFPEDSRNIYREEYIRQVLERQEPRLLPKPLRSFPDYYSPDMVKLARQALTDKKSRGNFVSEAVEWGVRHYDALDQEMQEILDDKLRVEYEESHGRELHKAMHRVATKDDLPMLWRVYQEHYHRQPSPLIVDDLATMGPMGPMPPRMSLHSCAAVSPYRNSRLELLVVLDRLGHAEPKRMVRQAIDQDKDVQRRAWGIFVATKMEDPSLVPSIALALEDDRLVPEAIHWDFDFEVDDEEARENIWRIDRVRVCDVAVWAIHELDEADEWPFEVPDLSHWQVSSELPNKGLHLLEARKQINQAWSDPRKRYVRTYQVGFTDEQIEHAQQRAAKLRQKLD